MYIVIISCRHAWHIFACHTFVHTSCRHSFGPSLHPFWALSQLKPWGPEFGVWLPVPWRRKKRHWKCGLCHMSWSLAIILGSRFNRWWCRVVSCFWNSKRMLLIVSMQGNTIQLYYYNILPPLQVSFWLLAHPLQNDLASQKWLRKKTSSRNIQNPYDFGLQGFTEMESAKSATAKECAHWSVIGLCRDEHDEWHFCTGATAVHTSMYTVWRLTADLGLMTQTQQDWCPILFWRDFFHLRAYSKVAVTRIKLNSPPVDMWWWVVGKISTWSGWVFVCWSFRCSSLRIIWLPAWLQLWGILLAGYGRALIYYYLNYIVYFKKIMYMHDL